MDKYEETKNDNSANVTVTRDSRCSGSPSSLKMAKLKLEIEQTATKLYCVSDNKPVLMAEAQKVSDTPFNELTIGYQEFQRTSKEGSLYYAYSE